MQAKTAERRPGEELLRGEPLADRSPDVVVCRVVSPSVASHKPTRLYRSTGE